MNIYDNRFNANEWFILIGLAVGISAFILIPKRFSPKHNLVYMICGIYSGFFFDHSLSVEPVNYYDVNDTSNYQFIDFLSYCSYGPISYLFFYSYVYWKVKRSYIPLFILGWALFSEGMEWVAVQMGVFHYREGYNLYYSFPIYLMVNSCWILFFHYSRKKSMSART
ncbi:hypothetical protein A8990_1386 [Paenibacillus taihuensis]|uniref:Uncharacterized protein n=1 Tax=Paenibacillus taihuensis TaxID=1156355 RepID=A0A3D9QVE8_9BACL|nr:hypothetical protein A8990_1386 [Paenibacillus taihuensis]